MGQISVVQSVVSIAAQIFLACFIFSKFARIFDMENLYQTPNSEPVPARNSDEVPKEILGKIKGGWIAACFSGMMTTGLIIFMYTKDEPLFSLTPTGLIFDVVLIFGLAFGIYKKSRVASTIMFIYFLASKILIYVETKQMPGFFMAIIFLVLYFRAMIGTYEYHKFIKGGYEYVED